MENEEIKNKEVKNEEIKNNEIKNEDNNNQEVKNEAPAETVITNPKELEELDDRYKRLLAEFENFKKRSEKERLSLYGVIIGDIISTMLPIMDNLDRAAEAKSEDTNYKDGVISVVKQFEDSLKKFGLEEIESVGKKFDPELHEAVSHIEDVNKGEKEIVEVYRKGYRIGMKVIRHAMVVVAN